MIRTPFIKIVSALYLAVGLLSACSPKITEEACPTGQMCTMIFASVGVPTVDAAGKPVQVKNVIVVNLRTKTPIITSGMDSPGSVPDHVTIATDGNKKQLSTKGDDVTVSATSVATGKTVLVTFKISGGCNCHVAKISGPDKIVFE